MNNGRREDDSSPKSSFFHFTYTRESVKIAILFLYLLGQRASTTGQMETLLSSGNNVPNESDYKLLGAMCQSDTDSWPVKMACLLIVLCLVFQGLWLYRGQWR